jgi:hypothetical protein
MVKWTILDPCEGLIMQGLNFFIKLNFFEFFFYKILRNMLIYKVQQFFPIKKSSKSASG